MKLGMQSPKIKKLSLVEKEISHTANILEEPLKKF
jgi:hypothetical protein